MSTITKTLSITLATAMMLVGFGGDAEARWGRHGRGGKGFGRGGRGLMRMHPQKLKQVLGLSAAQAARIAAIRTNAQSKRIQLRAKVQLQRLALRNEMKKDLPSQAKVLALLRKTRALRGKMREEGIKAHLKVLGTLTAEQRGKLRQLRGKRGRRGKFGKRGRRGRFGKHGRFGRGPRGRGMGRRGGPRAMGY